ncbi:hypothetical protein ASPZODRAFT_68467 [Penicilliopsis zonata CBS 506.65]|uniref:AMP-activated protein kinase glycogen-binding domain-containing protein n=1 Tax=Penicilliopsis zonata CBS 506.65 TaxID=1073090 RepID=A0A1L9SEY9_9EURO|nr:hypothetical protein ASPZODRAFT_68467 [Penicilliopsis zonata CBS 506.65]OJJ45673.1 hypothetical protein ASPZODRAFT_68467 [Penicilliopsis zonata CBS 506.65]
MTSTTLITFLLSAPLNTRSVTLLGSWDNFSRPYAMERDKRVGAGHWRGCYTFTDIVCDGSPNNLSPGRTGGLKMGGTYWYYYTLDDDIEFYNHAEPVTTLCPFLPGQPVNVLHVPIILPDSISSHSRDGSMSSQHSDYRTMDPEAKYMNPRKPPRPQLTRLRTSPPLIQPPNPLWSFNASPLGVITNKGTPRSHSANGRADRRDIETGHSTVKAARSVSPPRSRGFRAALRYFNTSTTDIDARSGNKELVAEPSVKDLVCDQLPLRQPDSSEKRQLTSVPIQTRRVLNPRSRDASPLRNFLTVETKPNRKDHHHHHHQPPVQEEKPVTAERLPPTKQLAPPKSSPPFFNTPVELPALHDQTTPTAVNCKEKRLPTLPSTPSSVMDEALRIINYGNDSLDMEVLCSHFSDFTVIDESSAESSPIERSHFSEWSLDTEAISPESMTSSLIFDKEKPSSEETGTDSSFPEEDLGPETPVIPTMISRPSSPPSVAGDYTSSHFQPLPSLRLSLSLSPSDLHFPGLSIDEWDVAPSNPKRHAALFDAMQDLNLATPQPSTVVFPDDVQQDLSTPRCAGQNRLSDTRFANSAAMQELMDELSYLKTMIESGASEFIN